MPGSVVAKELKLTPQQVRGDKVRTVILEGAARRPIGSKAVDSIAFGSRVTVRWKMSLDGATPLPFGSVIAMHAWLRLSPIG